MDAENSLRVVIVDDFDMTRTLLQVILRSQKFVVVGEAADGIAGVDMVMRLKPDIVLLDIVMPRLNGIGALEKIHAKMPEVMILMVTGNDDASLVKSAMDKGASGYIVKPFNTASVIETMKDARERFIVRNAAQIQRLAQK